MFNQTHQELLAVGCDIVSRKPFLRRRMHPPDRTSVFLDRPTRLLLAPEARFWELAGTIVGTVSTAVDRAGVLVDRWADSACSVRILPAAHAVRPASLDESVGIPAGTELA